MNQFQVVSVALVAVLVTALARQRHLNAPLVVLAAALGASFLPGLSQIELAPELILGVILPPLLFSAALSSSYQDFRDAIRPIVRLGVGLVIVTTLAVGLAAHAVDPVLSLPAALLLGAVVAPPDAVAAAAVGRRLGLPRRVMTLLGGESLINDATSLTLYRLAVAALTTTAMGSLGNGVVVFVLAAVVGVAIGLALAYLAQLGRSVLRDPTVDTVIGLMLPFVAYWVAEEYQGSGVLAVVAAGFVIGQSGPRTTVSTRLHQEPIWASIDLLLESFTFALIGLQLRWVIREVAMAPGQRLSDAFLLSGVVLLVALGIRPVYIYITEFVPQLGIWPGKRKRKRHMNWRELVVTSWAGMRGVVTLAAAAAIPAIPDRATVQLAAYMVAISTLLVQGITLPALIRALKLSNDQEEADDKASEARVRLLATRAAARVVRGQVDAWTPIMGRQEAEKIAAWATQGLLARETAAATLLQPHSDEMPVTHTTLFDLPIASAPSVISQAKEALTHTLEQRGRDEIGVAAAALSARVNDLRTQMVRAQRAVVVAERNAGRLGEIVMRHIMRELDLEEEAMEASWTHRL